MLRRRKYVSGNGRLLQMTRLLVHSMTLLLAVVYVASSCSEIGIVHVSSSVTRYIGAGTSSFRYLALPRHAGRDEARFEPVWRAAPASVFGRLRLSQYANGTRSISVPVWPVLVITIALSCYVEARRVCSARRKTNRCNKCGYDLRGCVSGACPECGTRMLFSSATTICGHADE